MSAIENPVLYKFKPPCSIPVFKATEILTKVKIIPASAPKAPLTGERPVKNSIVNATAGSVMFHTFIKLAMRAPTKIGAIFKGCFPAPLSPVIVKTPPRIAPFKGISRTYIMSNDISPVIEKLISVVYKP